MGRNRKKKETSWQPSFREAFAICLGRLLDARLNKWAREMDQHQQRGDDVGAAVLRCCIAEIEGDIEAARIAATPTRPEVRTLIELVESKEATQ